MEAQDTDSEGYTSHWNAMLSAQSGSLPRNLQPLDRSILALTRWGLVLMGLCFTLMVSLEVASRFLFGFSTYLISAVAKFTLLWFFLLGGGLGLRLGAHVGFTLLVSSVPKGWQRTITLAMQGLTLVFFLQMVWGGLVALGPAMTQTDPALNLSLVWAFLAIPVGFGLLAYHMAIMIILETRTPTSVRLES